MHSAIERVRADVRPEALGRWAVNRMRRAAFTLVEMTICVGIILILCALLLPAVQGSREAARRTDCRNNLFQMGIALHNYHDAHSTFPPGYVSAIGPTGEDTGPGWGWATMLLPFLDDANVFNELRFEESPGHPANTTVVTLKLHLFACPSSWSGGTDYVASFGRGAFTISPDQGDGVFFRNSRVRRRDIEDGGFTLLLGERSGRFGLALWTGIYIQSAGTGTNVASAKFVSDRSSVLGHTGPVDESDPGHTPNMPTQCLAGYGSDHSAGAHFLLLDGSVRLIRADITLSVFSGLATRAGGEIISGSEL